MPGLIQRIMQRNGIDLSQISKLDLTQIGPTLSIYKALGQGLVEYLQAIEEQGFVEASVLLGEVEIKFRVHLPQVDDDDKSTIPTGGQKPS